MTIYLKKAGTMTDKQIIIDGEKEDCKILFRCNHIDDLAAYNMIRNGIKITPENAPIGDFELMLIENTDSPFGFSSVCKRNNKEDVWEYSGFGHSGACSIVTALLKRLARKTQECESWKKANDEKNKFLQDLGISASGEFKRIKFYIEDLKNKYNEKVEECEELISEKDFYLQKIETLEEKLNAQFAEMEEKLTAEEMKNYELKEEIKELKHTTLQNRYQQLDGATTKVRCYEQALDEIKEQIKCLYSYMTNELYHYLEGNEKFVIDEYQKDILNIINKMKGVENDG